MASIGGADAPHDLIRVVLTGSESVGKTTLSAQLAAHYGVACVPEFVREYAAAKGAPLDFRDHGPIAPCLSQKPSTPSPEEKGETHGLGKLTLERGNLGFLDVEDLGSYIPMHVSSTQHGEICPVLCECRS
jgi:hypothetical protein